ncbi:MAG: cation diffusion facilitator family transporter [Gemmatimonadota bacterium]
MTHEDHEHGGGLGHGGRRGRDLNRLAWTLGLVLAYMAAEVVGGLVSGSLALLADAGHMLSDAASLALALFAIRAARRPPTSDRTWGFYRTEILAALANGVTLVVISLFIFWEAWQRFQDPPDVMGPLMMGVALGGLLVNGAGLMFLHGGRTESLNVRGAWLHVLSDAAGSVGAIVAGLLVWWLGWNLADPVVSVLIGLLVLGSSWTLLKESVAVLMEGTPGHLDADEVRDSIAGARGVAAVHDLHLWTLTSGLDCLSAHVVLDGERPGAEVLEDVRSTARDRFGIEHTTIQIEPVRLDDCAPPV